MLKVKEGFMLREVAGSFAVVAVGKASVDFKGVITLNGTGAFLFGELIKGCTEAELIAKMMNEYEVDEDIAARDIKAFITKLTDNKILQ